MKRQLQLNNGFEKWLDVPFFTDDTNAYELVYNLGEQGKGCYFKVTATRADSVCITDIGDVSENGTLYYTLADNMYGVEGELVLRVQILNGDTTLTEKILYAKVENGENGSENPSIKQPAINSMLKILEKKVDKEDGKGLSTNDFTNEEKAKLEGLKNYELPDDVVKDKNYVHTDNNYTTEEKKKLAKLTSENFSNALKGNISGEAVAITDISPVEHNMGVSVRRKNLIPPQNSLVTVQGYTYDSTNRDGSFIINTVGDSSIASSKEVLGKNLHDLLIDGKTYTFATDNVEKKPVFFVLATTRLSDNKTIYHTASSSNNFIQRFTIDKSTYRYDRMYLQINPTSEVFENVIVKPILALGNYATLPFAPYIEDLSAVKLYKGKNLISPDIYDLSKWSKIGTTTRYLYYLNLPVGIYTISAEKSIEDTYFHLAISTDNWTTCEYVYVLTPNANYRRTFTVEEGKQYALWVAESSLPNVYNVQIELGSDYTGYEEPIGSSVYDVKTDGIVDGVTSIYPNTTLYTNTQGALIECEYNRDINKAFAELQAMILEG